MVVSFSEACERDIRQAQFVRVAVYPAVRGWMPARVLLEVSDREELLGKTSMAHRAGHYPVVDNDPAEVLAAANALRGHRQRPVTLVVF